ncbi:MULTISPECIES: Cys-tRNA(Pro) deacylase [unclassified Paenibacillus]|uniref:Cys-tRNA(Pro) deacylase n=1 Tax=unclassified Paenibacillus TaxID=185978 RepID=UPI001052BB5B|nr:MULTISPECIES: Cys-tRNA(Pro) deacylase [unclassified Paenibacillus]NIK70574.1 Cys-tRNA(Pro)/Cys-tRNA(Cys) deacylase [Paenibacillus sp. BK720]TCM91057.1 Cys-tRNA(Pro)/Cys-tRNA(Cys) deacylase [Paenibacillus sp. BK033]
MSNKTNACRKLDSLHIKYTLHEYEWDEEHLDVDTVAKKVGLPSNQLYKTLVLRGDKTGIIAACIPGDKELNLKSLAQASGNKKVEMVAVKEIQALTGYIRGGVSPLGMKKNYPFYLHEAVMAMELVSISAGKRGLQIFLNGADLAAASEGKLVNIAN